jgi:hypothetical protein
MKDTSEELLHLRALVTALVARASACTPASAGDETRMLPER